MIFVLWSLIIRSPTHCRHEAIASNGPTPRYSAHCDNFKPNSNQSTHNVFLHFL